MPRYTREENEAILIAHLMDGMKTRSRTRSSSRGNGVAPVTAKPVAKAAPAVARASRSTYASVEERQYPTLHSDEDKGALVPVNKEVATGSTTMESTTMGSTIALVGRNMVIAVFTMVCIYFLCYADNEMSMATRAVEALYDLRVQAEQQTIAQMMACKQHMDMSYDERVDYCREAVRNCNFATVLTSSFVEERCVAPGVKDAIMELKYNCTVKTVISVPAIGHFSATNQTVTVPTDSPKFIASVCRDSPAQIHARIANAQMMLEQTGEEVQTQVSLRAAVIWGERQRRVRSVLFILMPVLSFFGPVTFAFVVAMGMEFSYRKIHVDMIRIVLLAIGTYLDIPKLNTGNGKTNFTNGLLVLFTAMFAYSKGVFEFAPKIIQGSTVITIVAGFTSCYGAETLLRLTPHAIDVAKRLGSYDPTIINRILLSMGWVGLEHFL